MRCVVFGADLHGARELGRQPKHGKAVLEVLDGLF